MAKPHRHPVNFSDDAACWSAFKQGDQAALAAIIERYERPLIGFLCQYCPDVEAARDIAQETFLKLIQRPPTWMRDGSLKPWLFRVARNLAEDARRKDHRRVDLEQVPEPVAESSPKRLRRQEARALLAQLPEEMRLVVSLRIYGDFSFAEIAKQLGIPLGTALWRMKRALEILRENLELIDHE